MRVFRGIYLSISLHLVILALLLLLPGPKPVEAPISFELLPAPAEKQRERQVVRALDLPDKPKLEETDDPLHFLSEKTQRVKEQLRAMQSGLTKNRNSTQKTQSAAASPQPQKKSMDRDSINRFMPQKITFPTAQQEAENQEIGISTLSEDLPNDLKIGDITSLDTDRYLFYSYFSRAQELLWNEWAPMVQALLNQPPNSMRTNVQRRFTTLVEVWFYPNGRLHSTHIMKPSGVPELDYLASASFRRVGLIPNPPREKIEADGLIRFKWGLTVEYDPKVLVRQ